MFGSRKIVLFGYHCLPFYAVQKNFTKEDRYSSNTKIDYLGLVNMPSERFPAPGTSWISLTLWSINETKVYFKVSYDRSIERFACHGDLTDALQRWSKISLSIRAIDWYAVIRHQFRHNYAMDNLTEKHTHYCLQAKCNVNPISRFWSRCEISGNNNSAWPSSDDCLLYEQLILIGTKRNGSCQIVLTKQASHLPPFVIPHLASLMFNVYTRYKFSRIAMCK